MFGLSTKNKERCMNHRWHTPSDSQLDGPLTPGHTKDMRNFYNKGLCADGAYRTSMVHIEGSSYHLSNMIGPWYNHENQKMHADPMGNHYVHLGQQIPDEFSVDYTNYAGIWKPLNTPTSIEAFLDPDEEVEPQNNDGSNCISHVASLKVSDLSPTDNGGTYVPNAMFDTGSTMLDLLLTENIAQNHWYRLTFYVKVEMGTARYKILGHDGSTEVVSREVSGNHWQEISHYIKYDASQYSWPASPKHLQFQIVNSSTLVPCVFYIDEVVLTWYPEGVELNHRSVNTFVTATENLTSDKLPNYLSQDNCTSPMFEVDDHKPWNSNFTGTPIASVANSINNNTTTTESNYRLQGTTGAANEHAYISMATKKGHVYVVEFNFKTTTMASKTECFEFIINNDLTEDTPSGHYNMFEETEGAASLGWKVISKTFKATSDRTFFTFRDYSIEHGNSPQELQIDNFSVRHQSWVPKGSSTDTDNADNVFNTYGTEKGCCYRNNGEWKRCFQHPDIGVNTECCNASYGTDILRFHDWTDQVTAVPTPARWVATTNCSTQNQSTLGQYSELGPNEEMIIDEVDRNFNTFKNWSSTNWSRNPSGNITISSVAPRHALVVNMGINDYLKLDSAGVQTLISGRRYHYKIEIGGINDGGVEISIRDNSEHILGTPTENGVHEFDWIANDNGGADTGWLDGDLFFAPDGNCTTFNIKSISIKEYVQKDYLLMTTTAAGASEVYTSLTGGGAQSQGIPVQGGKRYSFSGKFKDLNGATQVDNRPVVKIYDLTNSAYIDMKNQNDVEITCGTPIAPMIVCDNFSGGWDDFELFFIPTDTCSHIRIELHHDAVNNGGELAFDDLELRNRGLVVEIEQDIYGQDITCQWAGQFNPQDSFGLTDWWNENICPSWIHNISAEENDFYCGQGGQPYYTRVYENNQVHRRIIKMEDRQCLKESEKTDNYLEMVNAGGNNNTKVMGDLYYKQSLTDPLSDDIDTYNWINNTWEANSWAYGEQWTFDKTQCLDCYFNPIGDPSDGVEIGSDWYDTSTNTGDYLRHTLPNLCQDGTQEQCPNAQPHYYDLSLIQGLLDEGDTSQGFWDNAGSCTEILMSGTTEEIQQGQYFDQSDPGWGWSTVILLDRLLKSAGCFDGEDCCPPENGWNLDWLQEHVTINLVCGGENSITDWADLEIVGPWQDVYGHAFIGVSVREINWDQVNNTCVPPLNCVLTIDVPKGTPGCQNPKQDYSFQQPIYLDLGISGGCCDCCGVQGGSWKDIFPTGLTENVGLFYSIADQRWDVMSLGQTQEAPDGTISLPPPVGGITTGKHGEQIIAQAGEIKALHLNNKSKKPWIWQSKQYSMGAETQHKLFKGIKISANHNFNHVEKEDVAEGVQPGVIVTVDGLVASITRKDNPLDMDATIEGAHESQFHEYEYVLDRESQKGSTISVRLQKQSNDSIVESVGLIYRAKPVK